MKTEMINIFFLTFAAFLIATTTNSVATNGSQQSYKRQQEVLCKDYLGLERLFSYGKTAENQNISLNATLQCENKKNETYVRNDDSNFGRFSGSLKRTY